MPFADPESTALIGIAGAAFAWLGSTFGSYKERQRAIQESRKIEVEIDQKQDENLASRYERIIERQEHLIDRQIQRATAAEDQVGKLNISMAKLQSHVETLEAKIDQLCEQITRKDDELAERDRRIEALECDKIKLENDKRAMKSLLDERDRRPEEREK